MNERKQGTHYKLTMEKRGDILYVKAAGTRTKETVMAMSKDIFQACAQQGTVKVLIDERDMEGHLPVIDAYEIADTFFPTIRDRAVLQKSAILYLKESENRYRFLEDVAVNRGFFLRIFSEEDEAIKWLQE